MQISKESRTERRRSGSGDSNERWRVKLSSLDAMRPCGPNWLRSLNVRSGPKTTMDSLTKSFLKEKLVLPDGEPCCVASERRILV